MAKATVHNVDFTNVKEGGVFNTKRIEAGDYLAKIVKVEDAPVKSGDNKGRPQYLFTIRLVDHPSSVFPYYCQLTENQLWKLRNLLIAAGKAVPKKRTKVDPNTIVGKTIGVLIEDDEYERDGKVTERSAINGVFPAADLGDTVASDDFADDDDEDEEDAPLEDDEVEVDEPEVEEEEEEDDSEAARLAGMNRTQLKAEIIKLQSDFRARKSQSDDDLRDILQKLSAEEADEADEEEEAPAPAKTKAKAAPAEKKARGRAKPKVEEIDDEELDELDIDNL